MTSDFIDQFSDALYREKRGYLVAVHNGQQEHAKSSVHLRWDFRHWPKPGNGQTKRHDVLLAISAGFVPDGERFNILTDAQRQTVLGALDTLGVKLADMGHTWSEGEKEIFEQAIDLLKR